MGSASPAKFFKTPNEILRHPVIVWPQVDGGTGEPPLIEAFGIGMRWPRIGVEF